VEKEALEGLGGRLRINRRRRGDSQADAADRCGVSRETYRQMERGNPGTGVGHWIRAVRLYGDLDQLEAIFPSSLFDQLPGNQR
jgi:transcriptional regulator with XRE-family HTH domain